MDGFFKSFDGTKIFYSVEGKGPPLVFCYGFVCSKLHWTYQMDYLRKDHTVIYLDYRGHHNSGAPKNPATLTLAGLAHDIECLLDTLEFPRATILGHSMGVNVAMEFFRRAPQRTTGLVLAHGCARAPFETLFSSNFFSYTIPILDRAHSVQPFLTNLIWKTQAKNPLSKWIIANLGFNKNLSKASDIEEYCEKTADINLNVSLPILRDYEKYDALPWIHTINVPTLIIAGAQDHLIPKPIQEQMHQLIPGSQFELIRRGSHCSQMDLPDVVNVAIERFLQEHNI